MRNRIDGVRDGDLEQIALLLGDKASERWWNATRALFDGAPERVVIARDSGDNLCGFSIAVTPGNAPQAAHDDLLLGPWLEHATEHVPDGNAILWRDAIDFTGDSASGIQGMLNMVWVLRSGLDNPRYAYLPIDPDHPSAATFASALGATHIPELDFDEGPQRVQCHVLDYGENGLLGMQRAVVYMELGLAPPTVDAAVGGRAAGAGRPRGGPRGAQEPARAVRPRRQRRSRAATGWSSARRRCGPCSRTPPARRSARARTSSCSSASSPAATSIPPPATRPRRTS